MREYWERLKDKLREETEEVCEDINVLEELADVLEVVHAMLAAKGLELAELEALRKEKKSKRGGFASKIILEKTQ